MSYEPKPLDYGELKRMVEVAARAQFRANDSYTHGYYMGIRHGIEQVGLKLYGSPFMVDAEVIRMRIFYEEEALREEAGTQTPA